LHLLVIVVDLLSSCLVCENFFIKFLLPQKYSLIPRRKISSQSSSSTFICVEEPRVLPHFFLSENSDFQNISWVSPCLFCRIPSIRSKKKVSDLELSLSSFDLIEDSVIGRKIFSPWSRLSGLKLVFC
jgi:hypothetical protein